MALKDDIKKWLDADAVTAGYFPVETEISKRGAISVYIDHLQGVQVGMCADISRRLSAEFGDRLNGYSLVVSSAGLDRPLTHPLQFQKNTGKEMDVELKDGRKLKGRLDSVSETELFMSITPAKKKEVPQAVRILFTEIKEVKIVISFK